MTTATALLLTVLCTGAGQAQLQAQDPASKPAPEQRQAASGLIVGADIDGRLAIYDGNHRLVVQLDKPAGRQVQIALDPGEYEAQLSARGSGRTGFQIGEGQQLLLDLANFKEHDAGARPATLETAAHAAPPHHSRPLDGRHRVEVRFGGWGDGWYDEHGNTWSYSGSAQAAFGLEYLNFVRNDLGIGIAMTSLARADGDWRGWEDGGAGQATFSVPLVVRWYPLRRLTRTRSVEPYVTGGIGPVFGVDAIYTDGYDPRGWDHGHVYVSSTRVGTTFGGRVGGGADFRLGSVFTLGVGGAWNWDTGFSDSMWRGARPGGGEFTVALGWNFGR